MAVKRTKGKNHPVTASRAGKQSHESVLHLRDNLLRRIGKQGEFATGIPNLTLYRFDHSTEPRGYLLEPSVCVVLQGSKQVLLGEQQFIYGPDRFFVVSIDLPVIARILDATPSAPYLGIVFKLDRMEIARLVMESPLPPIKTAPVGEAIEISEVTPPLLEALSRLIDLLDEPEVIPVLAPLIQREILCRLLLTPCGPRIRQIAVGGSPTHQISQVIDSIKKSLREKLRIDDLAARAGMSVSTLHHHFRALTSLSPLQFQKRLRLNEARWLMLENHVDAATAAFEVGYDSPSQFSREYSRLFGAPPLRDIKTLSQASPTTHSAPLQKNRPA